MTRKQYRLDDDAVRIIESHRGMCTTLSDAVRNMELKITILSRTEAKVTQTSLSTDTSMTHPLDTKLTQPKVMTEATSTLKGFSRGTGAPSPVEPIHITEQKNLAKQYLKDETIVPGTPTIRVYGKIDPDEQIKDPRGFGGKKV